MLSEYSQHTIKARHCLSLSTNTNSSWIDFWWPDKPQIFGVNNSSPSQSEFLKSLRSCCCQIWCLEELSEKWVLYTTRVWVGDWVLSGCAAPLLCPVAFCCLCFIRKKVQKNSAARCFQVQQAQTCKVCNYQCQRSLQQASVLVWRGSA